MYVTKNIRGRWYAFSRIKNVYFCFEAETRDAVSEISDRAISWYNSIKPARLAAADTDNDRAGSTVIGSGDDF